MKKIISLFICFLLILTTVTFAKIGKLPGTSSVVWCTRSYEDDMIKLTYRPNRNALFYMVDQEVPKGWTVWYKLDDGRLVEKTIYKNRLRFFEISRTIVPFSSKIYYLKPNSIGNYELCYESTSILEDKRWDGRFYERCWGVKIK